MATNYKFDLTIIGAGIIGLSVAYKYMMNWPNARILIIEKEALINRHQTGRNSGVIHSGIYYKQGSYKSKNCLSGYHQTINFAKQYQLPYKITGKAIVATNEEEAGRLNKLYENGVKSGLNLSYLSSQDIRDINPGLQGEKGIWVPETGLTDYGQIALKLLELVVNRGANIYYNTRVEAAKQHSDSLELHLNNAHVVYSTHVINAAGLYSDKVYETLTKEASPIRIIPFKGEYYKLKTGSYQSEVPIYPVPNPDFPFLGIHITRMIDGTVKLGPNAVLSLKREGYKKGSFSLSDTKRIFSTTGLYAMGIKYRKTILKEIVRQGSVKFYTKSVQKYWKDFNWDMVAGYTAGIRAQAMDKFGLVDDFVVKKIGNQIHVLNAPSPAATSSLAIADQVLSFIGE